MARGDERSHGGLVSKPAVLVTSRAELLVLAEPVTIAHRTFGELWTLTSMGGGQRENVAEGAIVFETKWGEE